MKKLSVIILIVSLALTACMKEMIHSNIHHVGVERDTITIGPDWITVECDCRWWYEIPAGIADSPVSSSFDVSHTYFVYGENEMDTVSKEMNMGEYFQDSDYEYDRICRFSCDMDLDGLRENTTYCYYYVFSTGYDIIRTETKFFTTGIHQCVDLGLPSGTLWAICNVGGRVPEDLGNLYAWGEIQPKYHDNWGDPYPYYEWGNYVYFDYFFKLTKYCNDSSLGSNGFSDDLTVLLPEDDAATVNWGEDWRMPTFEEWQELERNTTSTWTSQNGVHGRLYTATNGNSLFLPFDGGYSLYWSSSLYLDDPRYAWLFNGGRAERFCGLNVRPVRSVR